MIWWDKFISNFKYIFINDICFIKKIIITLGKLTKTRVLRDGAGLCRASRGENKARKFFPSCGVGRGWGKKKPCGAGAGRRSHPSTPPRPITIPKHMYMEELPIEKEHYFVNLFFYIIKILFCIGIHEGYFFVGEVLRHNLTKLHGFFFFFFNFKF